MSGFDTTCEVIGWCLVAVASSVLFWALFMDRARGRKRCPKCWYDMAGMEVAAARCPECGRGVRSPRDLLSTRRRWRWVLAAFALWMVADAVRSVPAYRINGWPAFVPTTVLVACLPSQAAPTQTANVSWQKQWSNEFERRLFTEDSKLLKSVWPWERFLLRLQARAMLASETDPLMRYHAAWILVQADRDAIATLEGAGKAWAVVAASHLVYSTCDSYSDEGMHTGNIGGVMEKPFLTFFARSGQFRFEYLSGHPRQDDPSMRGVVWRANAAESNRWWTLDRDGGGRPVGTIAAELSAFAGVSSRTSYTVPMRLLCLGNGWWSGECRMTEDAEFDGRVCYRVTADSYMGKEVLWIDKESLLLRRLEVSGRFPSVTVYRPVLNPPGVSFPPNAFVFDASKQEESPLRDGREVRTRLRPLVGYVAPVDIEGVTKGVKPPPGGAGGR